MDELNKKVRPTQLVPYQGPSKKLTNSELLNVIEDNLGVDGIPNFEGVKFINGDMSDELKAFILDRLTAKVTLRKLREHLKIGLGMFYKAMKADPVFSANVKSMRDNGLEEMADDIINIADECSDIYRAQLKSRNIQWLLSKRFPKDYGDKLQVDIQVVNLKDAISEANNRANSIVNTTHIDVEVIDTPIKIIDPNDLW
jgi:hypothetical protein